MKDIYEPIERLLERECYVIDYLPERVPEESNGQFFDVEYYILNGKKRAYLKDKFVNVILKLMCYYHISILPEETWIESPDPEMIENVIAESVENHSGTLNCWFKDEDMLLVFDSDCLCLATYNVPSKYHKIFEKIAWSEGLFWWKSEQYKFQDLVKM